MYKSKRLPAIDAISFGIQTSINQMRTFFSMALAILAIGIPFVGAFYFFWRKSGMPSLFMTLFLKSQGSFDVVPEFQIKWIWLSLAILALLTFGSWALVGIIKILLEITDKGYSSARKMFTINFHEIMKVFCAFTIWLVVLIIGLVCFLIPGIIWLVHTYFYLYFIVDKNVGIFESFSKSIATTRGYGWQLFGFNIFMYMLQSVTFKLSSMISGISIAYLYRTLSGEQEEI